jgi:hypothetical protein
MVSIGEAKKAFTGSFRKHWCDSVQDMALPLNGLIGLISSERVDRFDRF